MSASNSIAFSTRDNDLDLFKELVRTGFKIRYNNSFLGFLWVLIKPLIYFVILFTVFTAFRGGEISATYAANLLLGIVVFTLIQEGVVFGMHSILDQAGVIVKVNFSRQLAIQSSIVLAILNFVINLIVLFSFLCLFSFIPNLVGMLYFLLISIIIVFFLYSLALFSSIIFIKFRDLNNIVELGLQVVFWGSAVFYSFNDVGGLFQKSLYYNPVALLINASRSALIEGKIIHITELTIIFICTLFIYLAAKNYFKNNIKKIAEFF